MVSTIHFIFYCLHCERVIRKFVAASMLFAFLFLMFYVTADLEAISGYSSVSFSFCSHSCDDNTSYSDTDVDMIYDNNPENEPICASPCHMKHCVTEVGIPKSSVFTMQNDPTIEKTPNTGQFYDDDTTGAIFKPPKILAI